MIKINTTLASELKAKSSQYVWVTSTWLNLNATLNFKQINYVLQLLYNNKHKLIKIQ